MTLFCPTSPNQILAFRNDVEVFVYIFVALPLLRSLSFVFTPVPVPHCIGGLIASLVYTEINLSLRLPSYRPFLVVRKSKLSWSRASDIFYHPPHISSY